MRYALLLAMLSFNILSMDQTFDPDKRKRECELLNAAVSYGYANSFQQKLNSIPGVNINAVDVYGRNVLHLGLTLVEMREEALFDLLLSLKISITQQDSLSGNTPLHTFLENLDVVCSYGNGSYLKTYSRKKLTLGTFAKKLLALTPKQVLSTPNHLGKIPFDYLDNEKINFHFPELKTLLKPPILSPFKPAVPRLLSDPFVGQDDSDILIKVTTDRKLLDAILHELKVDYIKNLNTGTNGLRKIIGKKLVVFLAIWDGMAKHLASLGLRQPEIAHTITWYQQFDSELTSQEKKELNLLDLKINN